MHRPFIYAIVPGNDVNFWAGQIVHKNDMKKAANPRLQLSYLRGENSTEIH